MSNNSGKIFSCLALYDWVGQLDGASWLSIALDLFRASNIEPNVAVYGAKGKWSRPVSLRALSSKLKKGEPLESIELYSLVDDYQTMMDADAGALFEDTVGMPEGKRSMVFSVPGRLESKKSDFFELCQLLAERCELRYGIGYELEKACGPIYYGIGIIQSAPDCSIQQAEEEEIGKWFRERLGSREASARNRHLSGKLRDVYRINILSKSHLTVEVNGGSLAEWIASDKRRGDIRALSPESVWWEIPADTVREIRKYLWQKGLLICK